MLNTTPIAAAYLAASQFTPQADVTQVSVYVDGSTAWIEEQQESIAAYGIGPAVSYSI